jgi:DNA-binding GntR family transcriptional regulator
VEAKSGWYVQPIDFARLDQLYDLRIVLELACVDRLVARREDPSAFDALKAEAESPPSKEKDRSRLEAVLDEIGLLRPR